MKIGIFALDVEMNQNLIRDDHLEHWLSEIESQIKSILTEVANNKVVMTGINVGSSGESYVSFEFLREKAETIRTLVKNIRWDEEND